jgi:hypothetical protein
MRPRLLTLMAALVLVLLGTIASLGGSALPSRAQEATPIATEQGFVGSWMVQVGMGERPSTASGVINPLFAEGLATFMADGTFIAAGSPVYPTPDGGPPGDQLFVGPVHGSWVATDERTAVVTFRALLRQADGNVVGSVDIDVTVELDQGDETLTGSYTVADVVLSRAWTRNLPPLDGWMHASRIVTEPPG